jgi:hypothetical protein
LLTSQCARHFKANDTEVKTVEAEAYSRNYQAPPA